MRVGHQLLGEEVEGELHLANTSNSNNAAPVLLGKNMAAEQQDLHNTEGQTRPSPELLPPHLLLVDDLLSGPLSSLNPSAPCWSTHPDPKLKALEARLLVNVITFRPITDRNCIGQTCEVKSSQAERGIPGRFIWHLLCLQQVPWSRSQQEFTCEIGEAQSGTPRRLFSILSGGNLHSQP